MFNVITNHVAQAVARLISQYQGKTTIEGTLGAIVEPIQDIENALVTLNTNRTLGGAVGVQLDLLGAIVGVTRLPGQSDASYLLSIQAQIKINSSQGGIEDVISTFRIITQAITTMLDEVFPAAIVMESEVSFATQAIVNMIILILESVAPAGVRIDGIVTFDGSSPFAFDGNMFGGGFGDLNDGTAGGLFASLSTYGNQFAFDGNDLTADGFGDLNDPLVGGEFVSL